MTITVSDFDHFTDRSFGGQLWDKGTSKRDIMWQNALFIIKGGKNHSLVRQTLTPAFTSSKLKMMLEGCKQKYFLYLFLCYVNICPFLPLVKVNIDTIRNGEGSFQATNQPPNTNEHIHEKP